MKPRILLVATTNKKKLEEFRELLKDGTVEISQLAGIGIFRRDVQVG